MSAKSCCRSYKVNHFMCIWHQLKKVFKMDHIHVYLAHITCTCFRTFSASLPNCSLSSVLHYLQIWSMHLLFFISSTIFILINAPHTVLWERGGRMPPKKALKHKNCLYLPKICLKNVILGHWNCNTCRAFITVNTVLLPSY